MRRDDLPALVEHFLAEAKRKHPKSPVESIAPDAARRLLEHTWPGNLRELEHVIERAVLLARTNAITLADLPSSVIERTAPELAFGGSVLPLRELQRRYAAWAYEKLGGRKRFTAETLGVDFKTLVRLLDDHVDS
jgi:two-component system response regulator HydG